MAASPLGAIVPKVRRDRKPRARLVCRPGFKFRFNAKLSPTRNEGKLIIASQQAGRVCLDPLALARLALPAK